GASRVDIPRILKRVECREIAGLFREARSAAAVRCLSLFVVSVARNLPDLAAPQPGLGEIGPALIPEHEIAIEGRPLARIVQQHLRETADGRAAGAALRKEERVGLSTRFIESGDHDPGPTQERALRCGV